MTRALVIVALVAWLAGTPVARASDTTVVDPRRDVRANGLSDLERQAVDIARVNATGGRFGVIVDVVFGGDADALLGQGGGCAMRPSRSCSIGARARSPCRRVARMPPSARPAT